MAKFLFTSESVTEGHPDKVCDQISDAVLDAILAQDKNAHVACESFCTTGIVNVMGEITTTAQIDVEKIVRDTVCEIGYNDLKYGFDGKFIDEQETPGRRVPGTGLFLFAHKWSNTSGGTVAGLCLLL